MTMRTDNLLIELFVEELPPKALNKLGIAFAEGLMTSLKAQGLTSEGALVTSYASPRRLAAHITQVHSEAADKQVQQKLMPVSVGLNAQGQATPALLKKLLSLGLGPEAVAQLQRAPDGKADALFYDSMVQGVQLTLGLQIALNEALGKLPIPKIHELPAGIRLRSSGLDQCEICSTSPQFGGHARQPSAASQGFGFDSR